MVTAANTQEVSLETNQDVSFGRPCQCVQLDSVLGWRTVWKVNRVAASIQKMIKKKEEQLRKRFLITFPRLLTIVALKLKT